MTDEMDRELKRAEQVTTASGICYRCGEEQKVDENSICNECQPRDE